MRILGKPAFTLDQVRGRLSGTPGPGIEGLLTVIRHFNIGHYLGLPMAYLLPRTILVVIAWGVTCALIRRIWPSAEMPAFAFAGATWLAAGVAYFGYLNKLRRDIVRLERARSYTYVRRFPLN